MVDATPWGRSGDVLRQPSRLFPPTASGVLLPRHDRAGALLGLTMYTPSRPSVVLGQHVAFYVARALGPWVLPARRSEVRVEEWADLTASWRAALGRIDSIAVYQRKDPRAGLTMLACRDGRPVGLVKCRSSADRLVVEQEMLGRLHGSGVAGLQFPAPLGYGVSGAGTAWAAQEFAFGAPHRPVFELASERLDDLGRALGRVAADLVGGSPGETHAIAHRDLTPWNLRRDRAGRIWLIDWEDLGWAPVGADAGYLALTAAALRGRRAPSLSPPVAAHWRAQVAERVSSGHPQAINVRMLDLLDDADG